MILPSKDEILNQTVFGQLEGAPLSDYARSKVAMTTPVQPQQRVRINVSTSVKGQHTYDATVELVDAMDTDLVAQCLAESDRLIAMLDLRYPAPAG